MKINQVEQLAGITKGNIRFYEKEGLLAPGRNSENGYREYTESDVLWLKKIRLLRMLDVPIEEILKLKSGELTLSDAMGRHMIQLERRRANRVKSYTPLYGTAAIMLAISGIFLILFYTVFER
jgi:DNA-binding transcriptional MerR regulator